MRRISIWVVVFLASTALLGGCVPLPIGEKYARIEGTVRVLDGAGEWQTAEGVVVSLEGTSRIAITGADGRYAIDVPAGDYRLVASLPGMDPAVRSANVIAGRPLEVDFHIADEELDQSQTNAPQYATIHHVYWVVQRFVPGAGHTNVSRVELFLLEIVNNPQAALRLSIREAGSSTELGTARVQRRAVEAGSWIRFYFDTPVPIQPGEAYELVVQVEKETSGSGSYRIGLASGNPYPHGALRTERSDGEVNDLPDVDLAFRTYSKPM